MRENWHLRKYYFYSHKFKQYYIRAVLAIVDGIDARFGPAEFRKFQEGGKSFVLAEKGMFMKLAFYKFWGSAYHIKNFTVKDYILDDVHFRTHCGFDVFKTDETTPFTLEFP